MAEIIIVTLLFGAAIIAYEHAVVRVFGWLERRRVDRDFRRMVRECQQCHDFVPHSFCDRKRK